MRGLEIDLENTDNKTLDMLNKALDEGIIEDVLGMFEEFYEVLEEEFSTDCVMTKFHKGYVLKFYSGMVIDGTQHEGVNVYIIKKVENEILRFEIGFLGELTYIRNIELI